VVWQGSPDHSDDAVTAGLLAKQNVAAYLWAALNRGKLQEDDLGFTRIPARVVAMRHGEIVFDERVSIPLMMPRRGAPAPTPSYHAQRDMLTIVETALSTMQRNASEAIAQVSIASINALREINAAQVASMERAQQTLERIGAVIADAKRGQAQTDTQGAHEIPQDPAVAPEAASAGSPQGQRKGPSQA
jgi:predicted transcriptional regulator